ncbi:MAG: alpha/beta hydrolase [Saprospiraceae bacterium]
MNTNKIKTVWIPKIVGFGMNTLGIAAPKLAAKISLKLFCTPRNGKLKDWHNKFLNTFQKKSLSYNDIDIMTYDNQKIGKTILLCHGWESNSARWKKLYAHLKNKNYRVVMMDAPAHGASGSDVFHGPLYAEMIDIVSQHYRPDIIIGHSIGGFSTMYYLSEKQPTWVNKCIILASPDKLTDITKTYFNIVGLSNRVKLKYEDLIVKTFGKPTSFFSASSFVKKINTPAIIIHDEKDNINGYWEGENIIKHWKSAKLITTKNLGHGLQNKEVFSNIIDFIEV